MKTPIFNLFFLKPLKLAQNQHVRRTAEKGEHNEAHAEFKRYH